jgi:hypothetical protein
MSDPEIREAGAADVPGILETMKLSLGETPLLKRTPSLWEWKHHQNPFGRSIVLVADHQGVIAGVRALMRWDLQTPSGAVVKCVRPVDTATHPRFLRRGLFRRLTMNALDIARDNAIDLVFNTPNEQSAPGYLKMGWHHVSWIGAQVRIRIGRAAVPSDSAPPSIEDIAPGVAPAPRIPRSLLSEPARAMRTPHSEQYLDWRFKAHPSASYGWVAGSHESGLVVRASTRRGRSELVASDILGVPHPSPVRRAAKASRARYMAGWFSPGSPKRPAAIRGGLLPVPGVRALRLVTMPISDLEDDPLDLTSWDLSTSDLELL